MWKQMSGFQSCLFWAGLKGCINIWVRCKNQRFGTGVSTLRGGVLVTTIPRLSADRHQSFAEVNISKRATPWIQMSQCVWVQTRKRGDNLPVFAATPVEASAAGWKIAGNCWSHWIQFGFGWKTKKNKALIAEKTRAGSSEAPVAKS